jgi:hypothetical protein
VAANEQSSTGGRGAVGRAVLGGLRAAEDRGFFARRGR